ncbi:MAG: T9SS type A sorting domain-containing protein [Bacteroidales bacterium]|jgi:hypothetical protein|nr:T9SS type A sorting domain-containing protein [Bacteroidales bacterium]
MSRYIIISLFMGLLHPVYGQGPPGSWSDHFPYQSVFFVTGGEEEIYGSTEHAITIFNSSYQEIRKLSKVNGLSDCSIATIGYSQDEDVLLIAYSSGNIDIYEDGRLRNIPDIMNYFLPGGIQVNRVRYYNEYACLATSHGIIIINLPKYEIKDTWKPSIDGSLNEVFDVCIHEDSIFAATASGLFRAAFDNEGLAFYGNWDIIEGSNGNTYNCLASLGEKIFYNKRDIISGVDSVFYLGEEGIGYLPGLPPGINHTFESSAARLLISSGSSVNVVDAGGNIVRSINGYGDQPPDARNAIAAGDNIFVADANQGMVRLSEGNDYESFIPDGPGADNSCHIAASGGQVWVTGGSVDENWDNTFTPFMLFNFNERKWWSEQRDDAWDAMRVAPVPGENSHAYVSTWGMGVFEYENKVMVNHWGESSLGSMIPGEAFVRVYGMAIDKDKNLWITQSGVQSNIKVLAGDNWIALPYNIDETVIGDILISPVGHKWIVLPEGRGLFVLDDNNTPSDFDDDRYKKFQVQDQDGTFFSNTGAICLDLDGNIWIGTRQGPVVYYYPDRVFDQDIYASRIKVPRNDGSGLADYLLGTEYISSIAVDGGNRKWMGTLNSGAFLIAESNSELVKNFNSANSPLPADNVRSIATDGETGEVWFGTTQGIVTLRETGTTGSDNMDKVYAYPNPVREDFTGNVTITGLAGNSNVKITDVSGNLVYETESTGGDATWDMTTYNGQKVSTGVYLVFCTSPDGMLSTVTKILIIR